MSTTPPSAAGVGRTRRAGALAGLVAVALALPTPALATGNRAAAGAVSTSRAGDTLAAPPEGRISVGDSITVGASSLLRLAGFRVNGKVGRQFSKAPGILRSYGSRLPRNVVIELGTNGLVKPSDCRKVLALAGPARRVFFVTNRMARSWQDANNLTLANCVATAPDRAFLIDWYAASADAWDWFAPDNVHLTRSGSLALTTLIDTSVDALGVAPAT